MSLVREEIQFNKITIPKIKRENRIPESKMINYISTFSGNEFEMFIFEWLKFCKKDIDENSLLFRIGGTGDKGVDIYYKNCNKTIYYQAKQYNHQLALHEIVDIVVKIFWYVKSGQLDSPDVINIVSSQGITSKTNGVIVNSIKLKESIIQGVEKSLDRLSIKYEQKNLESFIEYLKELDFSMIKILSIDEIIYDYYQSNLGTVRFYKQEPFRIRIPVKRESYDEEEFVKQIKSIFQESKQQIKIISDAKDNYYNCLCLKETDKYLFGNNKEFEIAKEEVYEGVNMVFYNDDEDIQHFVDCLKQATNTNISSSVLGTSGLNIADNSDKKGICHMLVNDGRLKWETKNEKI